MPCPPLTADLRNREFGCMLPSLFPCGVPRGRKPSFSASGTAQRHVPLPSEVWCAAWLRDVVNDTFDPAGCEQRS